MNLKIKSLSHAFIIVLWFYVASFIINVLIRIGCPSESSYIKIMEQHAHLVSCVIYSVIFIGIYIWDDQRACFIDSFKSLSVRQIITFIGMGLGAYAVGILITNLLIDIFPSYHEISKSFNDQELLLRWIAMVVLPPIVEEYLFRFKIQGILEKGFGKSFAILGQAILFGMLHYYIIQKIYAMVLGILFGYIRDKKQSIQASIWMHITVNFLGWLAGSFFS